VSAAARKRQNATPVDLPRSDFVQSLAHLLTGLARARAAVASGAVVDLAPLSERVERLCRQAEAEARPVATLEDVLAGVEALEAEMQAGLQTLRRAQELQP